MSNPVRRDTPTVRPPSRSGTHQAISHSAATNTAEARRSHTSISHRAISHHGIVSDAEPPTGNDVGYRRRESGVRMAQRPHDRIAIQHPVIIVTSNGEVKSGIAINISLGGAHIESDVRAAFGDHLRVRLSLPGLAEPADIEATVRWCSDTGFGVQFEEVGARVAHGLTRIVAR